MSDKDLREIKQCIDLLILLFTYILCDKQDWDSIVPDPVCTNKKTVYALIHLQSSLQLTVARKLSANSNQQRINIYAYTSLDILQLAITTMY